MIGKKRLNEFFKEALDKMFSEVGFDGFDEGFTKQENWFQMREWTEEREMEFRNWFYDECRTKLKMSKRAAQLETGYFLLMWGWKTKTDLVDSDI
jgi:hypothetical protein